MIKYIKPRLEKKNIKFTFWSDSVHWFDTSLVRRLTQLVILTSFRSTQISVWVARLMKSLTFGLGLSLIRCKHETGKRKCSSVMIESLLMQ